MCNRRSMGYVYYTWQLVFADIINNEKLNSYIDIINWTWHLPACYDRHWLYSWPEVPLIISLTGLVTIHLLLACYSNLIMYIFFPYAYTLHACAPSFFILLLTRSLIDDPEFAMLRSRSKDIAGTGVLWARWRSPVDHPQFSSWGF